MKYIRDETLLPGVGVVDGAIATALDYAQYAFTEILKYLMKLLRTVTSDSVHITPPARYNFAAHMYVEELKHPFEECPMDIEYPQYFGIVAPLWNLTPSPWLRRYYTGTVFESMFISFTRSGAFCTMVHMGYYMSSTSFILLLMIGAVASFDAIRDGVIHLNIDIMYLLFYICLYILPTA